ncbi:hypothetical protein [Legionella quateirensis]|uniref:Uncharacterized protein n=1 Tax=Legionella quateirensis TaxID=45072 RepID=A0A378KT84_9GAMM|nr:hypothetical protein [Legionella quateirensis]STY17389.1 Uncharacterised protein [Legionella quateirensis]
MARCQLLEIPRSTRDDGSMIRHPERSEGSPNAGTEPHSGEPSLHSG